MLQELVQQIEETARSVVDEIHTALPGTIVSFDPDSGMAVVQPEGKYVTSDGVKLPYPVITDVPLTFPFCQSAGVGMAFPVKKGDSCLIIISEIELDEWRSGAESEATLRFDLTSAMAIPGLLISGTSILSKACKQNAVILSAGETEIAVSSDGTGIRGDVKIVGNLIVTGKITSG